MKVFLFLINIFCCYIVFSQNFSPAISNSIVDVKWGAIESADLDGDGLKDLIVCGSTHVVENTYTYVYKNNGNGAFEIIQSSTLTATRFSSLTSGDIDGDGDIDVFMNGFTQSGWPQSDIYRNDGTGYLVEESSGLTPVGLSACLLVDVDNDGDLDIVYGGRSYNNYPKMGVGFNDGNGNFTESTQEFNGFEIHSLDTADINGDTFVDFVACGSATVGSNTKLFVNNGDGTFNIYSEDFLNVNHGFVHFIDINQDSLKDIFVTGSGTNSGTSSTFYLNEGGEFTRVGSLGVDSLMLTCGDVADVDLDGDEDIFVSGKTADYVDSCTLFINNNGSFELDTSFRYQGLSGGAAHFFNLDKGCAKSLIYSGFGDNCANKSYLLKNLKTTTSCFEDEDVSFSDSNHDYFTVLSNPFQDRVRVSAKGAITNYVIYDDRGRLVKKGKNDGKKSLTVYLTDLSSGTYFLKFEVSGYPVANAKIIKGF